MKIIVQVRQAAGGLLEGEEIVFDSAEYSMNYVVLRDRRGTLRIPWSNILAVGEITEGADVPDPTVRKAHSIPTKKARKM